MTDPAASMLIIALGSLLAGLISGAVLAGLITMERPPRKWTSVQRIPEDLHRDLRRAADAHLWPLETEITARLSRPLDEERVP